MNSQIQVVAANDVPSYFPSLKHSLSPVLLKEGAASWPCQSKWTPDFFASLSQIDVLIRDQGSKPAIHTQNLSDFIRYWMNLHESESPGEGQNNLYLSEWTYRRDLPDLFTDLDLPEFFKKDWIDSLPSSLQFQRNWIFIGHTGVRTPLHVDAFGSSAWVAMISGKKHFRFLEPRYGELIRPGTDLFSKDPIIALNGETPNISEVILDGGDLLYIPGGWPHQVRNLTKNIMVTGNFVTDHDFKNFYQSFRRKLSQPIDLLDSVKACFDSTTGSQPCQS